MKMSGGGGGGGGGQMTATQDIYINVFASCRIFISSKITKFPLGFITIIT